MIQRIANQENMDGSGFVLKRFSETRRLGLPLYGSGAARTQIAVYRRNKPTTGVSK